MLSVGSQQIQTVAVVDDDENSRQSLGWPLEDADLAMHPVDGPLSDIPETCAMIRNTAQALICDHHLSGSSNYATFSGAELVAASILQGMPSVLCTRYAAADILAIRPFLAHIPVLLPPNRLNEPDDLHRALADCIAELDGRVPPERKPWRTQLVVERIDDGDDTFYATLPAWQTDQAIRMRLSDVPDDLRSDVRIGFRFHAMANIGEERPERLFVTWIP